MKKNKQKQLMVDTCKEIPDTPFVRTILTFLGFYMLMIIGYINQIFVKQKRLVEPNRKGYVPLYDMFESTFVHYIYRRVCDCFNRTICSVPTSRILVKERITRDNKWTFEFTGRKISCINLGSYNYLGFGSNIGKCTEEVEQSIREHGVAYCSTRPELGTDVLHVELEKLTADFLGVDDAMVFNMGFATNALNLPSILYPGCLVVSDEKNHASLINGIQLSGACSKVFKHNDVEDLEKILREGLVNGQPNTGVPWKKVLIIVEGIYSMEGTIAKLPEILVLKKKYKAYLYVDEAHSIGAIGKRGRGITDYYGINPKEIDILMGTFTKSFGSTGGYIAGSKTIINYLRSQSQLQCYGTSMPPPVAQQIISSMKIMMGLDRTTDGIRRIDQLARNTRYFRRKLTQMGILTYGHIDSPVCPIVVRSISTNSAIVRMLMERNIASVFVGFPATSLFGTRIRFCISASHSKEQLDYVLNAIDEVSDILDFKYGKGWYSYEYITY